MRTTIYFFHVIFKLLYQLSWIAQTLLKFWLFISPIILMFSFQIILWFFTRYFSHWLFLYAPVKCFYINGCNLLLKTMRMLKIIKYYWSIFFGVYDGSMVLLWPCHFRIESLQRLTFLLKIAQFKFFKHHFQLHKGRNMLVLLPCT
jgi:hypothetical protein